jgi:hypothetical protein
VTWKATAAPLTVPTTAWVVRQAEPVATRLPLRAVSVCWRVSVYDPFPGGWLVRTQVPVQVPVRSAAVGDGEVEASKTPPDLVDDETVADAGDDEPSDPLVVHPATSMATALATTTAMTLGTLRLLMWPPGAHVPRCVHRAPRDPLPNRSGSDLPGPTGSAHA